jgi:hypothetical protein
VKLHPVLIAAAGVLAAATPALAQTPATCPAEPVRLDFAHAGGNRFDVTVEAQGASGVLDILWRPGEGAQDGTADFIEDLRFSDDPRPPALYGLRHLAASRRRGGRLGRLQLHAGRRS